LAENQVGEEIAHTEMSIEEVEEEVIEVSLDEGKLRRSGS
jgi:hypothetical protein